MQRDNPTEIIQLYVMGHTYNASNLKAETGELL